MKLVFPGGEHPQALLGPGINRVGSDPDCAIVLDRPGVRECHCELHVNAHGVVLRVVQDANVRVNARDVEGAIALRPGDQLSFQGVQASLATLEAPTSVNGTDASIASPGIGDMSATTVRPVLPRYVLRGISGAGFGRTFPLLTATMLGRSPECGIRFEHPGLSRHHARLTPTNEGLLLEDLGSTNGCVLNDKPVDRAWAQHGDEIGIDSLRFRVIKPGMDGPVEVTARSGSGSATRQRGKSTMRWTAAIVGLAAVSVLILFAIRVSA